MAKIALASRAVALVLSIFVFIDSVYAGPGQITCEIHDTFPIGSANLAMINDFIQEHPDRPPSPAVSSANDCREPDFYDRKVSFAVEASFGLLVDRLIEATAIKPGERILRDDIQLRINDVERTLHVARLADWPTIDVLVDDPYKSIVPESELVFSVLSRRTAATRLSQTNIADKDLDEKAKYLDDHFKKNGYVSPLFGTYARLYQNLVLYLQRTLCPRPDCPGGADCPREIATAGFPTTYAALFSYGYDGPVIHGTISIGSRTNVSGNRVPNHAGEVGAWEKQRQADGARRRNEQKQKQRQDEQHRAKDAQRKERFERYAKLRETQVNKQRIDALSAVQRINSVLAPFNDFVASPSNGLTSVNPSIYAASSQEEILKELAAVPAQDPLSKSFRDQARELVALKQSAFFNGQNNKQTKDQVMQLEVAVKALKAAYLAAAEGSAVIARELSLLSRTLTQMLKTPAGIANISTALIPGISEIRGLYEIITGFDLISGAKLDTKSKIIIGAGVLIGIGVSASILKGALARTGSATTKEVLDASESVATHLGRSSAQHAQRELVNAYRAAPNVMERVGTQLPDKLAEASNAINVASETELNAMRNWPGQIKNELTKSDKSIEKSIRSYDETVAAHYRKIADPSSVPGWNSLPPEDQAGAIVKWYKDIDRNTAYKKIAEAVLRSRKP